MFDLDERTGPESLTDQSIAAYEIALKVFPRSQSPDGWAWIKIDQAHALCKIGMREAGTARLQQVADASREALSILNKEAEPREWQMANGYLVQSDAELKRRKADKGGTRTAMFK